MKDFSLNEMDELTNNTDSVVLFYADWCPYCTKFKPVFEDLTKVNKNKIVAGGVKLNDDDNPIWDKFNINSVPTVIAFSKNSIKGRRDARMGVGLTKEDLQSLLAEIAN
jgi:thioredoxin 1